MTTDLELAALAKAGDEDAFARLVTDNQSRIYNLALRMTGNPSDAEELAQEAFFNAWRGLSGFQGDSSFATWLYRLTRNVCIDFLRKGKRRRALAPEISLEGEEDAADIQLPDERYCPETVLERKELRGAIYRGFDGLSEPHRRVLIMRELDGLTYAEIGELLALEEGTVKSRIARARMAVRRALLPGGNLSTYLSSTQSEQVKGGEGDK